MKDLPGLYVHYPFCSRHCPFCSFAVTTNRRRRPAWERALGREIELTAESWTEPFDTAYLGGGTPSLLGVDGIRRVLRLIRGAFQILPVSEVTVEVNPGDLGPADFEALARSGVNRVSIGLQSLDDGDLRFLGREHTAAQCVESVRDARRAGFENITVDLLYGLPERSADHWRAQVRRALDLGPGHISAYLLTYEPGTHLTRMRDRGRVPPRSDDEEEELYLLTSEELVAAGFRHYEVSSFARDRQLEARHNSKYWRGAPYLGLGPSAHSFRDPVRSWNRRSVFAYIETLERGGSPVEAEEALGPEERRLEHLFLGLRTAEGIDIDEVRRNFGLDLLSSRGPWIDRLEAEGLAVREGDRLRLSARGLARADAIALELSR